VDSQFQLRFGTNKDKCTAHAVLRLDQLGSFHCRQVGHILLIYGNQYIAQLHLIVEGTVVANSPHGWNAPVRFHHKSQLDVGLDLDDERMHFDALVRGSDYLLETVGGRILDVLSCTTVDEVPPYREWSLHEVQAQKRSDLLCGAQGTEEDVGGF